MYNEVVRKSFYTENDSYVKAFFRGVRLALANNVSFGIRFVLNAHNTIPKKECEERGIFMRKRIKAITSAALMAATLGVTAFAAETEEQIHLKY